MRILFLDDDENRHLHRVKNTPVGDDVVHVWTAVDAIKAMSEQDRFDLFELDHDLGGRHYVQEEDGTGTQVARYIAEHLPKEEYPDEIIIHSWNRPGAVRMYGYLKPTGIRTSWHRYEV